MDKLFSSSKTTSPVYTFTIDNKGQTVNCRDVNQTILSIFSFHIQKSKPHLIISRVPPPGWNATPFVIATCTLHRSPSSKIDVSIRGREFQLKRDLLKGDNHHFDYPPLGHFKWKPDAWGGSKLELYDSSRQLLAKYKEKTSLLKSSQQLEVFVRGDEMLLDMILVTALVMRHYMQVENKQIDTVMDVLGNLSGST
ncbi:uncharacterized protein ACLA_053020 [Aspergillus clavatus NRRL 1]|uniref:DUF6593 domain-containing protein n=1 Tax=Aspergillus clavatus (strain ATCC 1007 / CBS 513.65 / DSM 816 / NCTC 3887 / NRRL 1 / QM 1276 / 107) TaxID=344612 RepID=A1CIX3_ASPCL|nr:uncharacterized protein ACLA_053020 [Aspergillus clavatus NRRL 1]EAW10828.1 conserved hypothetical protein [Aspergillus clavatus NRRL 1]